jgi:adenylate cyclase
MALALAGGAAFGTGWGIRYWTLDRARLQIRNLFGRYVSEPVMRELTRNPASLALGGTRRRVTVLFSDINDFTPICERHTPEEVLAMLNAYFEEMVEIVFRPGDGEAVRRR